MNSLKRLRSLLGKLAHFEQINENQAESAKPAAPAKKEPPKEVINEKTLKKTQDEAAAANEDNHKLRKEIFDARTKLGLPVQQPYTDEE